MFLNKGWNSRTNSTRQMDINLHRFRSRRF